MSVVAHAICSLDDVKTWLGITTTDDDTFIEGLIDSVTYAIEAHYDRRVKQRSTAITERFSGDGTSVYYVKYPPIEAGTAGNLTEITIEYHTNPVVTDWDSTGDEVRVESDTGRVQLLRDVFAGGYPNNCTITYKGGWSTVPYDYKQAAIEVVAEAYHLKDKVRQNIESLTSPSGETVRFFIGIMRPETAWKLQTLQNMRYR